MTKTLPNRDEPASIGFAVISVERPSHQKTIVRLAAIAVLAVVCAGCATQSPDSFDRQVAEMQARNAQWWARREASTPAPSPRAPAARVIYVPMDPDDAAMARSIREDEMEDQRRAIEEQTEELRGIREAMERENLRRAFD